MISLAAEFVYDKWAVAPSGEGTRCDGVALPRNPGAWHGPARRRIETFRLLSTGSVELSSPFSSPTWGNAKLGCFATVFLGVRNGPWGAAALGLVGSSPLPRTPYRSWWGPQLGHWASTAPG
jgi:hypothetical protein